jgi:acetyl esterase/lipase
MTVSPKDSLDPEIARGIESLPFVDLDAGFLAAIAGFTAPEIPASDAIERTDHFVPGDPEVRLRVYRPTAWAGPLPGLYYIHGGGYVVGTAADEDAWFDEACPKLGFVGVSVDYRLAPGAQYPDPLEDCYRGLQWTLERAGDLGIAAGPIGVMGLSAGGGLAAALTLLARERGGPPIAFQLLDQPMLDDRQTTPSSTQDGLPVWSRNSNTFGWQSYLGDLHGRDDVPATAAPARASDLSGLPPAFVSVGAVDGFRDEDIDYAWRLNQAGVPTELHVYPGACHGWQKFAPDAPVTKQAARNLEEWLAAHLRPRSLGV